MVLRVWIIAFIIFYTYNCGGFKNLFSILHIDSMYDLKLNRNKNNKLIIKAMSKPYNSYTELWSNINAELIKFFNIYNLDVHYNHSIQHIFKYRLLKN